MRGPTSPESGMIRVSDPGSAHHSSQRYQSPKATPIVNELASMDDDRSFHEEAVDIQFSPMNSGTLENLECDESMNRPPSEKRTRRSRKEREPKKGVKPIYKQLTINTDHEDSDESIVYGQTIYQSEMQKRIDEYLDESKENALNFKAMVKYFGVTDTDVELPSAINHLDDELEETKSENAHVQSIGTTHEDKMMFIKFVVSQLQY